MKLLKKMGWKGEGHGLGKEQQGIAKPVEVDMSMNRAGFGFTYHFGDGYDQELRQMDHQTNQTVSNNPSLNPPRNNRNKVINMRDMLNNIHKLLANFMSSQTDNDLVFDKSLSADERKFVHREAHKLGLKTRSEGAGENRFLVVSKKRSTNEIIESTMSKGDGQFSKYKLISKGVN